jgi:hypothetical protein
VIASPAIAFLALTLLVAGPGGSAPPDAPERPVAIVGVDDIKNSLQETALLDARPLSAYLQSHVP